MPSTAKQSKTTAYDTVRANPFTRVPVRPTHSNYKILKSEASALASKVKDITYLWSKNAMDNYGLLANIILDLMNMTNSQASTRISSQWSPPCTTQQSTMQH
jgi:hypothetical protein